MNIGAVEAYLALIGKPVSRNFYTQFKKRHCIGPLCSIDRKYCEGAATTMVLGGLHDFAFPLCDACAKQWIEFKDGCSRVQLWPPI